MGCLDELPWLSEAEGLFVLPGAVHSGPPVAHVTAALAYTGTAIAMITALKYRRDRTYGRVLGEILAIRLQERLQVVAEEMAEPALLPGLPDVLVPVPLHGRRRVQRGYNQASLIAQTAGYVLCVNVSHRALVRCRETDTQVQLGRDERLANLAGAFVAPNSLAGLRVALVDDVVTTGATLSACVGALRKAGVQHIECWVVARTLLIQPQAVSGSKV